MVNKKCLHCKNEYLKLGRNQKFCCLKCKKNYYSINNCIICSKKTKNPKFCSLNCYFLSENFKIAQSEGGEAGWEKANETNKKNKSGVYGISKEKHQEIAMKSNETNKKNKTSVYDTKIQIMGAKASHIICKKNKTGSFFNPKIRSINVKKSLKINKINGTDLNGLRKKGILITPFKDTKIERKIQDFLTQLQIEYLAHKHISEITHSYQCDIFIPVQEGITQKTIIECDGDAFHFNPKIYNKNSKIFKEGITAKERWKLDGIRTKELQEKGFKVIRLWENEIKIMNLNNLKNKL